MEQEFDQLKELFQHKKASANLSAAVADKRARHQLARLKKNHLINIVIFLFTAVAVFFIDEINSKKMETSSYGFWILIGCALYYALSRAYLLYRLNSIKPTEALLPAIQKLEQYKKLNIRMHTYGELLYVLILSFGVYIYLRPVLDKFLLDKTGRTIICFWWVWGSCILWMLIHTLFIKRRRMKKDIIVLEECIQSLKS